MVLEQCESGVELGDEKWIPSTPVARATFWLADQRQEFPGQFQLPVGQFDTAFDAGGANPEDPADRQQKKTDAKHGYDYGERVPALSPGAHGFPDAADPIGHHCRSDLTDFGAARRIAPSLILYRYLCACGTLPAT